MDEQKTCVCGHPMTAHEWKNQWVCHRCGRTKPLKKWETNADRIRAMSDEELAEYLVYHNPYSTIDHCLGWLQQYAEDQ